MEYFTRLRRFWFPDLIAFFWLLLALPAIYFFQTTIHEGTHGLVALATNGDFPKVAPFPHLTQSGSFLNGVTIPNQAERVTERVTCDPNDPPISHTRLAGWIGWPQMVALFITIIFAVIFLLVDIRNPLLAFLLRAWYFAAAIDFLFNVGKILFGVCTDTQDWARVMIRGDINSTLFWFLTFLLVLVVLSHFLWVYWSRWGKQELDSKKFNDYKWIGLFFAILSTLALIISLAVNDPAIKKDNAVFILGLIVQICAAVFYWLYFAWLSNRRTS
jgi:hypothetical protein